MPRSRPASNPLSFHKATGQHYVTRGGRRVYLGADRNEALARYHRLALGLERDAFALQDASNPGLGRSMEPCSECTLTVKELANRFIAAQQANWREPTTTKRTYLTWLGRFLADHPRLLAANFTLELFAAWKLTLRSRGFAPKSINHYLGAVRALFKFADEAGLLARVPRLSRIRNEPKITVDAQPKELYTPAEIAYVERKANRYERYAARFAAKEAGMKAIGTGWRHGVRWQDFEVANLPGGKPTLRLHGVAAQVAAKLGVRSISLSLTHTAEQGMAFVILED